MIVKRAAESILKAVWSNRRPKRYHFIHIPKNAGRSIRHVLELRGGVILTRPLHYRYRDLQPRQLKYFGVVRNPWSRTASRYHYSKQTAKNWPDSDKRKAYITDVSFKDFVMDQRVFEIPEHPGQPWMGPMTSWFDQLEWLEDENHQVVCDCLRFEHLASDLDSYFGEKLRLPHKGPKSGDYRPLYTDALAEIVAKRFARDIEYFGFTFDGAATRNTIA
jgi:hypothetical protein